MNQPEALEQLKSKRKELSALKAKLSTALRVKEETFKDLRSIRDKIKSRSQKITNLKQERNALTDEVKKLKGERDKLNDTVKNAATMRKQVDEKKKDIGNDTYQDPRKIKILIEQIERKIETEVMPFNKEQELNKRVKELKAEYKKISELGQIFQAEKVAGKEFVESRKKAQESHKEVQEKAHDSQEKHVEVNKMYEELKSLREQEKPINDKFSSQKKEFEDLKVQADAIQIQVSELSKICNEVEDKSFKDQIVEKTTAVKEKLKKGGKLTTADILALQALDERD